MTIMSDNIENTTEKESKNSFFTTTGKLTGWFAVSVYFTGWLYVYDFFSHFNIPFVSNNVEPYYIFMYSFFVLRLWLNNSPWHWFWIIIACITVMLTLIYSSILNKIEINFKKIKLKENIFLPIVEFLIIIGVFYLLFTMAGFASDRNITQLENGGTRVHFNFKQGLYLPKTLSNLNDTCRFLPTCNLVLIYQTKDDFYVWDVYKPHNLPPPSFQALFIIPKNEVSSVEIMVHRK
jgi:hypothetical protein